MNPAAFISQLEKEATSLEDWSELEEGHGGKDFAATRLIVAESLRRVALAMRKAEEA
jgi:hypothetical protein